jgi:NTE family protein
MKIGLSLSGGGYRAAAFHLGTLRKLKELNTLDKIDVISTVSGGSIIGAYYALHKDNFDEFDKSLCYKLEQSIIRKVLSSFTFLKIVLFALLFVALIIYLEFTLYAWLNLFILILGIYLLIVHQFRIFPVSTMIEKVYNDFFYHGAILGCLPEKPMLAINSTNLQTGRLFTFSKHYMGDSSYHEDQVIFDSCNFPIALAVMSSSSVPFAFTPVQLGTGYYKTSLGSKFVRPILVDGGVYDNQGIHKLTHPSNPPRYNNEYECDIVITSDAGNKMPLEGSFNNLVTLLLRCMDLFMNRIKLLQIIQNLYLNKYVGQKEIAYISLGWDLDKCITGFIQNLRDGKIVNSVIEAHCIDVNDTDAAITQHLMAKINYEEIVKQELGIEAVRLARSVSTNLTGLSSEKIKALSNHAALQTELQVKLYCPSLF